MTNELGVIYGRGTVVEAVRVYQQSGARLRCQCGNIYTATLSDLRRGYVTSCGCRRRDNNRSRHRQPWRGRGDREELAWAAGIFDGEGYIGTVERKVPSSGRRIPYLQMSVNQWHSSEVIDRFAAALGIGRVRSGPRGDATEWIWRASGLETVQASIAMLWPWLSGPKRAQAARSLESYHLRREVVGVRSWRRRHVSK